MASSSAVGGTNVFGDSDLRGFHWIGVGGVSWLARSIAATSRPSSSGVGGTNVLGDSGVRGFVSAGVGGVAWWLASVMKPPARPGASSAGGRAGRTAGRGGRAVGAISAGRPSSSAVGGEKICDRLSRESERRGFSSWGVGGVVCDETGAVAASWSSSVGVWNGPAPRVMNDAAASEGASSGSSEGDRCGAVPPDASRTKEARFGDDGASGAGSRGVFLASVFMVVCARVAVGASAP